MLDLCRLRATAEFGRASTSPQCHSSRSPPTPPPRCARRRPSPPTGGRVSPRRRRSEQEPPYAIALPFQGEVIAERAVVTDAIALGRGRSAVAHLALLRECAA